MITARHHLLLAQTVRPAVGHGEDRVAVVHIDGGVVLVVADGAGGMRGAAEAADFAVQLVVNHAHLGANGDERDWAALIARIDASLRDKSGQCALLIAAVREGLNEGLIVGASAGDCGAWLISEGIEDLTEQQVRKPLVGSGSALPVPFRRPLGAGTLLLASDGLLKYGPRQDIAKIALREDLDAAARDLVLLTQLRSGDLPDDMAVVLCRARRLA